MKTVPRIVYTVVAGLLLVLGMTLLGTVIDPEGLLWFVAWVVGVVLVSLTDRHRFGWIE